MYVQKNQEKLFEDWRYAVTTVFFDVPPSLSSLNEQELENMEYVDKFMLKVAEQQDVTGDAQEDGIDLQGLMSKVSRQKRWVYRGSFTTPPCIEGVLWNIYDDVLFIKPITLKLLTDRKLNHERGDNRCSSCGGNNRKLEPINDRTVYYLKEEKGSDAELNRCRYEDRI